AVWTLSEDDARAFAALGATHVAAFDVPPVSASPARPGRLEWDVALLGNWTWEPNARGLRWFADQVLPLISADTTVAIGGAGACAGGGGDSGAAVCCGARLVRGARRALQGGGRRRAEAGGAEDRAGERGDVEERDRVRLDVVREADHCQHHDDRGEHDGVVPY